MFVCLFLYRVSQVSHLLRSYGMTTDFQYNISEIPRKIGRILYFIVTYTLVCFLHVPPTAAVNVCRDNNAFFLFEILHDRFVDFFRSARYQFSLPRNHSYTSTYWYRSSAIYLCNSCSNTDKTLSFSEESWLALPSYPFSELVSLSDF